MVRIRYELDDEERHVLLQIRREDCVEPLAWDARGNLVKRARNVEVFFELERAGLVKLIGARERILTGRRGYELTAAGNALADELECASTNPGAE